MFESMNSDKLLKLLNSSPSNKVVLECINKNCSPRLKEIIVKSIQKYADGQEMVYFKDTHDNEIHCLSDKLNNYQLKYQI